MVEYSDIGDTRYWAEPATLTVVAGTSTADILVKGALLHTAQITASGMVDTTTTQAVVSLQGSIDAATAASAWASLDTVTITAAGTSVINVTAALRHVKCTIDSINTGAGTFVFSMLGAR